MHDLISVIIPLYNGQRFLAEAIESVRKQTHPHVEVLIVDDGSTDDGQAIARSFSEVRYVRQPNQGNASARNLGVQLALGQYVAFLDQDDRFAPDKLEIQLRGLKKENAMFSLCYGRFILQDGYNWPHWLDARFRHNDHLSYVPGSMLVHKSALETVGLFDTHYAMGSDSDWFFRAKDAGVIPHIARETLLFKRIHGDNQSNQVKQSHHELVKLVHASILRQRGTA